jgi:hypothetical protein
MFPIFIILAFAENGLRLLKGKSILRANDTIASISQGLFQECVRYLSLFLYILTIKSDFYLTYNEFQFKFEILKIGNFFIYSFGFDI